MKSDYALRALFTLVDHYQKKPLSIREIAAKNHVPKRYLEQIMLELKHAGWVTSTAGRDGGFMLSKSPDVISMGQVIRHFEELLAPIACVSVNRYEACDQEPACRFRRVLLDIRNHTADILDSATLAKVHAGRPVEKNELAFRGFMNGEGI